MKKKEKRLVEIINKSEPLVRLLKVCQQSALPQDYYIGAGCIANTVWNYLSGNPFAYGISDIDVVYFDDKNTEIENEVIYKRLLLERLEEFPFKLDVKNEARVHLWYKQKFGFQIEPYTSLEDAIDSWPTTATSLGIRRENKDSFVIYAPYQLDDLFSMVIRPNKKMITKEIYEKKAEKWQSKWDKLTVIPW
ncbi:nucleotidyltransferase family protein [Sporolactobacillus shoreicorticis]|uniref:Nucleotidyltransferase family protein n=1 Tax=Sporolactobacillus shoreicorticis TaxID=1923877 RepID=A0ABW5S4I3_9BACL|nr:nucleotidyltransferase family protein [Sporolactobacillus shoreicorticis]MCO7127364.1 nucleotidyltransferase family protein [Sporolactobacillus shoreicorticis]